MTPSPSAHPFSIDRAVLQTIASRLDDSGARRTNALVALLNEGRFPEAEALARESTKLFPADALNWMALGAALMSQGRMDESLEPMEQAAALSPESAEAHSNLGAALQDLGRLEEAETCYLRALAIRPDFAEAHSNLAVALRHMGRFDEAEAGYRRALAIRPEYAKARHNLGHLLLTVGRYAEAWPCYEFRYHPQMKKEIATIPNLPYPQWRGEPLAGKSLAIWPEQGFGDYIQFVRYAALLKERGLSRLTLVCPAPLKELLETVAAADAVLSDAASVPSHDYWSFHQSLPLHFCTTMETIPAALPYLRPLPARLDRWHDLLPAKGFRVGLAWKGSPAHKNNRNRSLPGLNILAPLWSVPGTVFVSLQKGEREDEALAAPQDRPIIDLGSRIEDFADTAAIVSQLDLVICVDTAVAHVAGALGKPCWVLLPHLGCDWRWLREREDSPWYPGVMRLFRQGSAEGWEAVIERVAAALRAAAALERPGVQETAALVALFNEGRYREAELLARELTALYPGHGLAWKVLGAALKSQGHAVESLGPMKKAAALSPGDAGAHSNLGVTLNDLGRLEEAEASYRRALEIDPGFAGAHSNLGNTLRELGRLGESEASCRRALEIDPDFAEVHSNLGSTLNELGHLNESEASCRRALEIKPDYAEAHNNLGNTLRALGRLEEAEASYLRVLGIKPDFAEAHSNRGIVLNDLGRWEKAEAGYRRALEMKPDFAEARHNLGHLLLSAGRYAEAWPFYEFRKDPSMKGKYVALPDLPYPQWHGESLAGKSLLIWPEQGLGDYIQFVRYAGLLKERGLSRLTLLCPSPLKALLETMGGVDAALDDPAAVPPHDYWSFPISLPLHLGTTLETIPASLPYLHPLSARQDRWHSLLPAEGFKVGLVWKGAAVHKNDRNRSLPGLPILAPLWSVPGVAFVSLQKGQGEEEALAAPAGQPIVHLGSRIADFADTAAVIAQLDLVICVDTSIAHVAGALGKPCWVLLPAIGCDWRWLREREDSPWYPGALRLFRQGSGEGWEAVIERVVAALAALTRTYRAESPRAPHPPSFAPPVRRAEGPPGRQVEAAESPDREPAPGGFARRARQGAPQDAALATLLSRGRYREAELMARQVTDLFPERGSGWKVLGSALRAQGRAAESLEPAEKAIALSPEDADAYGNLGATLRHLGRLDEAEACCRRALQIKPDCAAYCGLGIVLKCLGRLEEAEACYRCALEIRPDYAEACSNLSVVLQQLGRLEEAEAVYRMALRVAPGCAEAHGNLGVALRELSRFEEAEACQRRALQLKPEFADAHGNLGNTLRDLGRLEEAEACYRRALQLKPEFADAHGNLGVALRDLGRFDEAEASLRRALSIKPDAVGACCNLGQLLLHTGRYAEAWPLYEFRHRANAKLLKTPALPFPQWQGEPLAGKSLLIWPEQGFGDYVQFVRYAALLKECGLSRLTLLCPWPLKALLETMDGVDAALDDPAAVPLHDYWSFPLSLPLHCGTTLATVPASLPYLRPLQGRADRWRDLLPAEGFKVGLVWKGAAAHKNDGNRSLPSLSLLSPLWSVPGTAFVSLQKGEGEDEALAAPAGQPIVHLGGGIADFADTAAVVAQLDLVICVDTAVAHVAGALGKLCWVLLPYLGCDWRWLREREDSPWYPGVMRLFRQGRGEVWGVVIERVAAALETWVASAHAGAWRQDGPGDRETHALVALFNGRNYPEAELLARETAAGFPGHGLSWKVLGVALKSQGRVAESLEPLKKAVALSPEDAQAYNHLGLALKTLGRFDEAVASYRRALEIDPGFAAAHNNLGNALKNLGRFGEGEACHRRALEIKQDYAEARCDLGDLLGGQGRLQEAEVGYRLALEAKPDYARAHGNLGVVLRDLGRPMEAEAACRRALAITPGCADTWSNLGVVLHDLGRPEEAEASFRRASEIAPDYAVAHGNRGNILLDLRRLEESEACYRRALAIRPDWAEMHKSLGQLLLSMGRYDEAWSHYEFRNDPSRKDRVVELLDLPYPQWRGEPLAGKSLAIWPEQGFGDYIQFVRYATLLKERGLSQLTLVCAAPLRALLATMDGVDAAFSDPAAVPPHDYWSFHQSLPLRFGTTLETVPASLPYLHVPPGRAELWRERLPAGGVKVGLAWKGNPAHQNDGNRSLPGLAALSPLWSVPGVTFVSLQKGEGEDEALAASESQPIFHLGGSFEDFADTAAIVAQLDLVICVDTAVAHVAGALGKPCWVLLPYLGCDWRWLREREDSPWYPGALRLFRQEADGGWAAVIQRVAEALRAAGGAERSKPPSRPAARRDDASDRDRERRPGLSGEAAQEDGPGARETDALVALFNGGKYPEAELRAWEMTEIFPAYVLGWKALGAALGAQGRAAESLPPLRKALALTPADAESHGNLGAALKDLGRSAEAEASYRRALRINPDRAAAHNGLGGVLKELGRLGEAEACYRRALEVEPDCAEACVNLGNVLKDLGRLDEAAAGYGRALEIKPDFAEAHNNLGIVLKDLGHLQEAEASYRRALEAKPDLAQAYNNLSVTLKDLGHLGEAEACCRRALEIKPDYAEARTVLGRLLLSLGLYAEAWPLYESRNDPRRQDKPAKIPDLPFPPWQGEPLAGKSLAIWPEQGFGDYLQFVRYAAPLKERGLSRLTLVCASPLKALLETMAGVDAVLDDPASVPAHDYWSFHQSLPLRFCTNLDTVPGSLPYLHPLPGRMDRWRERLPTEGFKVGLVWKGSAAHKNDGNRSLPGLAALSPLWSVPGIVFVSLQKGQGEDEALAAPKSQPIVHLGGSIEDFADTAAVVAQLDLTICVDTAVAHVAGALGKPCWVLLPHLGCDWRWLREREDSPWYPGALRLFRRGADEGWPAVIERVAAALAESTATRDSKQLRRPAETAAGQPLSVPLGVNRRINPATRGMDALAVLFAKGSYAEAELLAREATALSPGDCLGWKVLGAALKLQGRVAESLEPLRKAVALSPEDAEAHSNLGVTLRNLGRLEEAQASYRRALEISPNYAEAHSNLAVALNELGRTDEARTSGLRALEIRPDYAEARSNLGQLLLSLGLYAEAWPHYESRNDPSAAKKGIPDFHCPQWQGESLAGKSLAIWPEQGFGDYVQFVRYAALLKERGLARLTLICRSLLKALLETAAGVDAATDDPAAVAGHDFWSFPLSLPLRLGTTLESIPASLPYLRALPARLDRWRERLPERGFKVGLVWKGDAVHKNDRNRSLPGLAILSPLWSVPGVAFVSLQKGRGEDEALAAPRDQPIFHLGGSIEDFADTAAVVAQLDMVICVDTAVAHVAGALGKPCWVLLPHHGCDWRWLKGREDSPWYPGVMRLFRQQPDGDWDEVIERVAAALATEIGSKGPESPDVPGDRKTAALVALFNEGRHCEAELLAREITTRFPGSGLGWKVLGAALKSQGRVEESLDSMRKAAALSPEDFEAHNNVGAILDDLGRRAEAEASYRRALETKPDFAEGHYNLGNALHGLGRLDEAEAGYRRALEIKPDYAAACRNLGITLQGLRRPGEAEASFRRALEIEPYFFEACCDLGAILNHAGRPVEAEAAYRRALEIEPDRAGAHVDLGVVLKVLGRPGEAEASFRRALEIRPDFAEAHINLGAVLKDLGRAEEAATACRRAVEIAPDRAEAHLNLGVALKDLGRRKEAEASFRTALEVKPGYAEACFNLGNVLKDLGRRDEAQANYRRALEIRPGYAEAHVNLGVVLQDLGRPDEAEASFRRALEIEPDFAEAYSNLGHTLRELGRPEEAEANFRRALEIKPDFAPARFNLGLALLSLGRYEEAWPCHESRYSPGLKNKIVAVPDLPYPQWRGEPLAGKSLAIWPEQGFGDYIQFVRYATLLKERGLSRLTLVCRHPLKALLETADGVDEAFCDPAAVPLHDFWSFPLSLPLHFGTDLEAVPASLPYLRALPARADLWRQSLPKQGCKVGLVWKGAAGHGNDRNRSLPSLSLLSPLWGVPGVAFVSLQKGRGEDEALSAPKDQPIVHLGGRIGDFADTAAIVAQLDLVICVDTAVAHVAGALGKPCWVLLPHLGCDWRWLRKREDSPWYPGALRLFREEADGGWPPVIERVVAALEAFAGSERPDLPASPGTREITALTALFNEGRHPEAEILARETTRLFPGHGLGWKVLGAALGSQGRVLESLGPMAKAAALSPEDAEAWGNLGSTLKNLGLLDEAEANFRRALAIRPDYAEAHGNLGNTLKGLHRFEEAEACYRRALEIKPDFAGVHNNRGNTLKKLLRLAEAEASYRRALEINPDYAEAHNNLGNALRDLGRSVEAETSYRRALKIKPYFAEAHSNLGNTLKELSRLCEAEASYRRALEINPGYAEAHSNLGNTHQDMGRLDEAEADYRRALEIMPDYSEAHFNQGLMLLSLGRYDEAWPHIEFRYHPNMKKKVITIPSLLYPQWQGEPLDGKSLVVWPEQGFGDFIQFVRYAALLKERGLSRLTLVAPSPLKALLETAAGVDAVVDDPAQVHKHDYWSFHLSLPLHFGTTVETIPASLPYLHALPDRTDRWRQSVPTEGFKVGLVWKGAAVHKNDGNRSLPGLATLAPLWSVPGVAFVSLQKGQGEDEARPAPEGQPIVHLGGSIEDFADTAAIVAQLDLVICVDTAIAHIAGALGKPCWVLLPYLGCDWRWLREREDSPWYPGVMRLFRQDADGGWAETVARAAAALASSIGSERRVSQRQPPDPGRQGDLQGKAAETVAERLIPHSSETSERENPGPDEINALVALFNEGSYTEAEFLARKTTELFPGHYLSWKVLGAALGAQGRVSESLEPMRKALALSPEDAEAQSNLSLTFQNLGRLDEAEAGYRRSLEIKPDYAKACSNLGQLLLSIGRYAEAWPLYEFRHGADSQKNRLEIPDLPFPQWQGESLAGKSLAIWPEQGFGDYIQFVRYAPLLKERGLSRLTVVCRLPLMAILETMAGVDAVLSDQVPVPAHDYWSFPLSLPLRFGTTVETIPASLPYLHALPTRMNRWRESLPTEGFKIGLVWKGTAAHKSDGNRSLPGLATLAPLWSVPGLSLVSLQKGQAENEALHAPGEIVHLGSQILDFADTAAIVEQLDLVICVDTAIAHVAGALGRSCWVLLPHIGADWRWFREREDSPWYPGTLRLFRRGADGGWAEVIARVVAALEEWIAEKTLAAT